MTSLLRAGAPSFNPGSGLGSGQMIAELLALHEEIQEQLRVERLGAADNERFLAGMIAEHAKTAELLRAQLEIHAAP